MAKAKPLFDQEGRYTSLWFNCPGCEVGHHVVSTDWVPDGKPRSPFTENAPRWGFNGDLNEPTLTPSVLAQYGWGRDPQVSVVCHSFVKDGHIQFLDDCTHALAGQTVELPQVEP